MKDSQIIKTLRTFSKKELGSFEKFVHSPYFNTSEATSLLFDAIKNFYPHFSGPGFTREKLFAEVYGKRKFSLPLFNKLASNLIKLTENYIAQNGQIFAGHGLLNSLRKKKLHNRFLSHYARENKKLGNNFFIDDNIILKKLIYDEYINYLEDDSQFVKADIEKNISFEFTSMLFFYRFVLLYPSKKLFSKPEDPKTDFIQLAVKHIDIENLYKDVNASDIKNKKHLTHLLSLLLLKKNRSDSLYEEIKDFLFASKEVFETSFMYPGFIYLLDQCTKQIAAGNEKYYRERYQIYKVLEKGYFAGGKIEMNIIFYKNFISSGIINGDIRWAAEILDKYYGVIEKQGYYVLIKYLEALILFSRGEFEKSLKELAKCDFLKVPTKILFYRYELSLLRLMVFFELGHFEEALSLADSVSHILNKGGKVTLQNKTAHMNFIKYFRKLVHLWSDNSSKGLKEFMEKLPVERVFEKKWLLEKAQYLARN